MTVMKYIQIGFFFVIDILVVGAVLALMLICGMTLTGIAIWNTGYKWLRS